MVRANSKSVTVAVLAALLLGASAAMAQMKYETADGYQTVAPSQMNQLPQFNEQAGNPKNISLKTRPQAVIDQPGVPGVASGTSGTPAPGAKTQANQEGALVMPGGYTSTMRNGPTEPVGIGTRVVLALFLMLQAVVAGIIALAMFSKRRADEDQLYGGHLIDAGYKEPLAHRRGFEL